MLNSTFDYPHIYESGRPIRNKQNERSAYSKERTFCCQSGHVLPGKGSISPASSRTPTLLPLDEVLAMLGMDKPNEEQVQLMTEGMVVLVGVLGNVVSGIGELKP